MMAEYFPSYILQVFIKNVADLSKLLTFWDGVFLSLFLFLVLTIIVQIRRHKKYKVRSVSINIPFQLGNITYEPTEQDRIIAWKLYAQLMTRKAALIFDEDHDIIVEVYDSLYELFSISRNLIVDLAIYEIEREPNIADFVLRVQNDGIRPHLTKWQYDFRRWWDSALKDVNNADVRPQEIQEQYPRYKELIDELKQMNIELSKYAEDLLGIAKIPPKRKGRDIFKQPVPVPPTQIFSESDISF